MGKPALDNAEGFQCCEIRSGTRSLYFAADGLTSFAEKCWGGSCTVSSQENVAVERLKDLSLKSSTKEAMESPRLLESISDFLQCQSSSSAKWDVVLPSRITTEYIQDKLPNLVKSVDAACDG